MTHALEQLTELDRRLTRQLFWEGRGEDNHARERGVSQLDVSKRKQKILQGLRRQMGTQ